MDLPGRDRLLHAADIGRKDVLVTVDGVISRVVNSSVETGIEGAPLNVVPLVEVVGGGVGTDGCGVVDDGTLG